MKHVYLQIVLEKTYLPRLKTQLELLRKTFIEPSMRNARARLWPREEDFRELDECIFGLARTIRLKKLLAHDEAIVLVDRKWRELRLATTLTGLMRAALNDKRQFAKAPEAVVHLNRIYQLAKGTGPKKTTRAEVHLRSRTPPPKEKKLSDVRWSDYEELLLTKNGQRIFLQCGFDFPSKTTNCCARYLEMERDYWLWRRDADQWETWFGDQKPCFEWIEQNDIHDAGLDKARLERKRQAARERQRRRREKILEKKCDKELEEYYAKGGIVKGLRDLRVPTSITPFEN